MSQNLDEIELRSEEVQEVLAQAPRWMIRWGSALILGVIFILLFISWFVKYPDIIVSKGVVSTIIPPQKEYARATGRLSSILVNDSQKVEVGQPLAIIENTARYEDIFYLKSILDTITIQGTNFEYPINDIPILFLGDVESTFALFENSYIQYKINKDLQPFSNQAAANRFSISELTSRAKILETQQELNAAELKLLENDLTRHKLLFERGVISSSELEEKQLAYLQSERAYKNLDVSMSRLEESLMTSRMTSRGSDIKRVKEEMVLLKGVIQSLNNLKKSIKDWELTYVLQSSLEGQVSFLNFWDENQFVSAGDLVFTILPKNGKSFIARLKTPAQNSGKLKQGQKVLVRLDSYPDSEFGLLEGTLDKISVIADENGFYNLDVVLPNNLITTYNKRIIFKQEMTATAEIITEDLRLLERLFYQLREVFRR